MIHELWQWHPPVGVWIGVLGLLGVIIPFFRDLTKINRWERAGWTILLFLLLGLELKSLYQDRAEHDEAQKEARDEQLRKFGEIAWGINKSIATNKTQFQEMMGQAKNQFQEMMGQARANMHLSTKNLEQVTGGDSFAFVVPQTSVDGKLPLAIHNNGNNILTGVSRTNPSNATPMQCIRGPLPP